MRIVHVAETIKGGIATYLRELIPFQCDTHGQGNVVLIVPQSQIGELGDISNMVVVGYPDSHNRIRRSIRVALKCLEVCREFKPDIVHIHSTFAGVSVRPTLRLFHRKIRVLYCPHGWAWDRPLLPFVRTVIKRIEVFLSRFCDRVICISEHEYRSAIESGFSVPRLALIRNAIAETGAEPCPVDVSAWRRDGCVKLLFVGRLDSQKGVDVVLDAMRHLGNKYQLVIAGASVVSAGSVDMFPENCVSVGWVSPEQLESLYAEASLLVVPSRWEGFGLVAIEGMRAALPVVASNVGALPEIVEDGVTGVVFESESSTCLAKAILSLSQEDMIRMGAAGQRKFVSQFTIDRLYKEMSSLYLEVV